MTVGGGKRLFAGATRPSALKLVATKISSTGVVVQTYERAGAIEHGEFEVDKEGGASKLWT